MSERSSTPTRRAVVVGVGAAGLVAASPAVAQFDLLKSGNVQQLMGTTAQLAQGFAMREEDEAKMGQTYYEQYIGQGGGRYPDRNAQEALAKFAQPFIATSRRKKFPWEIALLQNNQVNAWAIPGGKLAINSELVKYTDDPAELGSVIAHEIGHAEMSHGVQQMRTQAFMATVSQAGQIAIAATLGKAAPLTGAVFQALQGPVFTLVNAGYSRQREFEADNHILGVFQKTGQDPQKASDFFKTLMKVYPSNSDATTSLFSTHPGTQARIDKLNSSARAMPRPPKAGDPPGWAELKAMFPTPAGFGRG